MNLVHGRNKKKYNYLSINNKKPYLFAKSLEKYNITVYNQ